MTVLCGEVFVDRGFPWLVQRRNISEEIAPTYRCEYRLAKIFFLNVAGRNICIRDQAAERLPRLCLGYPPNQYGDITLGIEAGNPKKGECRREQ